MNNIINFKHLRQEKEKQFEAGFIQIYKDFHHYLMKQVNIREKVRAKHFLKDLTKKDVSFNLEDHIFIDWFGFDYLTVQDLTLFQLYLKRSDIKAMNRSHAVQQAVLLANVLEPFKIAQLTGSDIVVEKLDTKESARFKRSVFPSKLQNHDFIFVRNVPIFDYNLPLGSFVLIEDSTIIKRLMFHYKSQSNIGWRTFLKKYAIQYVMKGKTV
ncbi:hypothetical protein [Metabacillus arenae]|uniref:Uncharacterized protein n=1 Tax=Metabacillus arenae TaxID=2771434 RepID=A0A926NFH8_9BACI|nr:hypothetical protein [Metabacillus arenae]MBD1380155.1 hypothetical protein [Metabacillus arenae]